MSLGSGVPVGWTIVTTFGNNVRAWNDAGCFFPHQWFDYDANQFNSPIWNSGNVVGALTVLFAWTPRHISTIGTIATLMATDTVGNQFNVATLKQESDATLSVYIAASPVALLFNTGSLGRPYWGQATTTQTITPWYYIQWDCLFSTTTVGGVKFLTLSSNLTVDGEVLFTNVSQTSNFITLGDFSGGTNVGANQISFQNQQGLSEIYIIDEETPPYYLDGVWAVALTSGGANYSIPDTTVTVNDTGAGFGAIVTPVINPVGGTITNLLLVSGGQNYSGPSISIVDSSGSGSGASGVASLAPIPNRRIAQAVIEPLLKPTTSSVRINQAVNELLIKPNSSHVRISQAVIELLVQRQIVPGGWNVSES